MKYIKLFALLAAVVFLGACSDDDDKWNSASDVTVNMANAQYSPRESSGIVKLPINVEGATNGLVSVTVETAEVGENPAKENVNYYVTSKTVRISDGQGNLELEMVDDKDINESRTFTVTIVSAKGAKIGENKTTTVTIRDNDSEPYDRLQGSWKMTGKDNKGNAVSWDVTVTGADSEDDAEYNKTLWVNGMCGMSESSAMLSFYYDEVTNKYTVSFDNLGTYNFITEVDFGFTNPMNIWLMTVDGNNVTANPVDGDVSDDLQTITFTPSANLTGWLVDSKTGEQPGYIWFGNGVSYVNNIVMKKSN